MRVLWANVEEPSPQSLHLASLNTCCLLNRGAAQHPTSTTYRTQATHCTLAIASQAMPGTLT